LSLLSPRYGSGFYTVALSFHIRDPS
jgi:hypothetical protein